ncbi:7-cyano-7-deazaguanosine (preQ0) biosynthesis protein QueE [Roseibium sp. TrichSKD4]|uniref:7-carboxy-7-deazaguanine synthase QueE n=1 Tax=Roseibium sp. TrichSKD4 TaxID=744980 RepID=UPI0001E56C24|nr:7-carboxy-7-deazaguanine synthase QueE [Roseibium sp. TrichSKD4]EFO32665.1 7-cyano-7-deazaguanosine (preQ0) biosynthesis protein QueE [Roseibium sp. TrichSKD4]
MADGHQSEKSIRISEIFGPTIQGEGALVGKPTVFVRTGGCDYRCSWCDTLHAVDAEYRHDWTPMSAAEIFTKVEELSGGIPLTVSLSGGNPAIQPLASLITLGKAKGYAFALETQGSVVKDWFAELDVLTLSPKPPSSGMKTDLAALDACVSAGGVATQIALKFAVMDEADYAFARQISTRHPALPVYLQPVNHTPPPPDTEDADIDMSGIMDRMRWLVERTMSDRWYSATLLPQLHVLIWGNLRGV